MVLRERETVRTLYLLFCTVHSFVLDTRNYTIYNGTVDSYFGYSVGLLKNSDGVWALVGAPRADDIFQPWVRKPGALYKCPYPPRNDSKCQQVNVDSSGNSEETIIFHRRKIRLHHDKTHQWLGVSLDVDPENQSSVLICAHRWKDNYLNLNLNGIAHMNGICYQLHANLSQKARKIPALTVRERLVNRQRYAEFSMGGLGMSAIFTGMSGYLLLGAPGLNDWSGGAVLEKEGVNKDTLHYIEPPRTMYQDFQIGASLAVGNYLFRSTKSIALGSPRLGKVLIYEWMDRKGKPTFTIEDDQQFGSGFGTALLTYRIRGEHLDDMIIGAPYYTSNNDVNTGRVYVYKSRGIIGFGLLTTLKGTSSAYAQFGTSIGLLGDLNNDGFDDIAVGAPYEENGKGGIYIFNGHKSGIWPTFSQHVRTLHLHKSLKGFGISFSRPMDLHHNGKKKSVLAIGCHRSSSAVVLQSADVLDIKTSVEVLKMKTNICVYCAPFKVCFKLTLPTRRDVFSPVILNFTATISKHNMRHSAFLDEKTHINSLHTLEESITLKPSHVTCSREFYIILKDSTVGNSGIQIEVEHVLQNSSTPVVLNKFQGRWDEPTVPSRFKYKFHYNDFCGNGKPWSSVSKMQQEWEILDNFYLVIDPGIMSLVITVSNDNIPVNDLIFKQRIPGYMHLMRLLKTHSNQTLPCTVQKSTNTHHDLRCFVGNISANESVVFRLYYVIQEPMADIFNVTVQSSLTTNILETEQKVVFENYTVKTARHLYADIKRYSRPTNFLILNTHNEKWSKFNHGYFITLLFPGKVESIHFLIPVLEDKILLSSSNVDIQYGKADMKCRWGNFTPEINELDWTKSLETCRYGHCELLSCEIWPSSTFILISASFYLSVNSLNWPSIAEIMEQQYSSEMCYKSRSVVLGENPLCRSVTIRIKDISQHGLDGRVHYWFITLSVFVGVAVLLLLICIFWKCGFFYRRARQELKLKIEIQKLSTANLIQVPTERDPADETDSETFVLTPFPSGSDETQILTPPPCYRDAIQRTSNSSTDCFFTYDDDDGYLQPVFCQ